MSTTAHPHIKTSAKALPATRTTVVRVRPRATRTRPATPRFWWIIALAFVVFALASLPFLLAAASSAQLSLVDSVVPALGALGGFVLWLQGMWSAR